MELTPEQLHHICHLNGTFNELAHEKYRKGALEHGGTLMDMPLRELLVNAREEAIDMFVYLQTAIDKMDADNE